MLGFLVQMLKRLAKKGFVVLRDKPKFRKRFDTAKKRVTTLKKYLIFIDLHVCTCMYKVHVVRTCTCTVCTYVQCTCNVYMCMYIYMYIYGIFMYMYVYTYIHVHCT